jgi:ribonuclease BN (tRNA processing enzyme)
MIATMLGTRLTFVASWSALLLGAHNIAAAETAGTSAASASEGTRIILLGTGGGPIPRKLRSQPASLMVVNGRPYLVDCGDGVIRQLALAGFTPPQVEAVFLTHLHFDHTQGVASVVAFDWAGRRKDTLQILGPPGTELLVRNALAYDSVAEAIFTPELPGLPPMSALVHARDVDASGPTIVFQDDRIRVLAVANSHYVTMTLPKRTYGTDKSYSYRFESPTRTVVFTGDTGPSAAVAELARGADVLVSEIIDTKAELSSIARRTTGSSVSQQPLIDHMLKEHLAPDELGKLARAAGVKRVILTHFAPGEDSETDVSGYVKGVERYFAGPVTPGRDLDQF